MPARRMRISGKCRTGGLRSSGMLRSVSSNSPGLLDPQDGTDRL